MAPFDLADYRRRAEEFTGALDLEAYQHFAGLKQDCDFTAVYDQYPELFTLESVRTLRRLYDAATADDDRRRLSFLLNLGIEGFLGNETKQVSDEIANTESRAKITVDGEQIGLRYSSVVQANEPDRARRRRINDARNELTSTVLNPLYDQRWRRLHELVGELGYPTYSELFSEVRAVDFGMLRGATQMFLQATEGLYQRTLDKVSRAKLGIPRTELEQSDLPFLVRAPEYDHIFASAKLLPTFERTLQGLGVSLAEQSNVHVDAETRELKSPRAFCAPVRIPDEIYLVVMPKGGQDDFQALLHEGGHTEHFAHTSPDLPFEYRFLGDNAVTEGFAFVFDHLTLNPRWLQTYLDYAESQEYLTFANLVELYFLRRYAGKLAYETEFHVQTGPLDHMAERYGALLSQAVQIEVPQANYLVDIDEGFYASNYLRAWMLEGALRMLLQDNYGMEWFLDPAAGAWLKGLWSTGQMYSADQLLLKNGGGRLDTRPLELHLERALGR
ncbi:MAG: hypothetical protein ACXVP1_01400 [Thermoleophilia bacterium]